MEAQTTFDRPWRMLAEQGNRNPNRSVGLALERQQGAPTGQPGSQRSPIRELVHSLNRGDPVATPRCTEKVSATLTNLTI
jgi:hypothetical protein